MYSKGNWRINQKTEQEMPLFEGFSLVIENDEILIALCDRQNWDHKPERLDNARLLVTAPKLHQALIWALSIIEPIKEQWTEEIDENGPTKFAEDFILHLSAAKEALDEVEGHS
jgi:hypothetical protein